MVSLENLPARFGFRYVVVRLAADLPQLKSNGTFVGSNSELILYSYAQPLGTVSITPLLGVVMTPGQAQTLSTPAKAVQMHNHRRWEHGYYVASAHG